MPLLLDFQTYNFSVFLQTFFLTKKSPEQEEGFWPAAEKFTTQLLDEVDRVSTAMVCVPYAPVMGAGAFIKCGLYGGRGVVWLSGKAAPYLKAIPWSKIAAHITKTAAAIGRKLPWRKAITSFRPNSKAAGNASREVIRRLFERALFKKEVQQYTRSTMKYGREMHAKYKRDLVDPLMKRYKEYRLYNEKRIDYLDGTKGVIYELKPNNPRGIQQGNRQLKIYKEELEKMADPRFQGIEWNTQLELY